MIPAALLAKVFSPLGRAIIVGIATVAIIGGTILYFEHRGAEKERAKQREQVNDAADDRRKIDDRVRDLTDDQLDDQLRKPPRR